MFYIKIFSTYVDDFFILSHKQETIISLIESINHFPENDVFTDEEYISNYLGVNTKKNSYGTF